MINNKKDFSFYLAARLIGTLGMQMQSVAIGWQVYHQTQNPMDLGLIGLMQFLPVFGFSLFSGQLADRIERHRIVWVCHAIMAMCCFSLFLLGSSGQITTWSVYMILFVIGTSRAFLAPAAQSYFPYLVSKDDFSRAIAMNTSVWQFAVILGPSIGGFLYALTEKPHLVYLTSSCMLLTSSTLVFFMKTRSKAPHEAPISAQKDIWAGLRFIRQTPEILGATTLDLFAVLLGGATALLPAIAKDILHTGPSGLGLLRSAPAVGAALMGLLLSFKPIRQNVGKRMFISVFAFGIFTLIFGLSKSFWISWFALLCLGSFDMISVVTRQSLVQLKTPGEMRGRVSAVNSVFIGASNELGEFESGVTAAWFGVGPAVIIGGIGTCTIAVLWSWLFPELRKMDKMISYE